MSLDPRELWQVHNSSGHFRAVLIPTTDRVSVIVYAGARIGFAEDFSSEASAERWALDLALSLSENQEAGSDNLP